jgi:predicted dehydrogenase
MNPDMDDRIIQVGVLGLAHTAHAASYSNALTNIPGARLAAVFDDDPQRGSAHARQFDVLYYSNLADLLDQADIRAVIVTSATLQHKDLVCAAARAGKHVLCEKPIATNLEDARIMMDACLKAGVLLQIAYVCRFYPFVQTAKRLIEQGELGQILGIVGGNRGRPPLPPMYPQWITDPHLAGGGALLDHSVHVTDAMRFILGTEVQSVFAEKSQFSESKLMVEDCGLISLSFENGTIASVDPSWSIPENNPYHYDFFLRLLCEKGFLEVDDTHQVLDVVSDLPTSRPVNAEPFGVDVDQEMVSHFINCVRANQHIFPAAHGEDGLRSLEIALAAYRSTETHQPVILPLKESVP